MDKYYTPDIEEFYVGFEYVRKLWFKDGKIDYDGIRIDTEYQLSDLMMCFLQHPEESKESFLVKYLDKEDIESLGWKFKHKSIDIWFELEGSFDIFTWTGYKAIMHYGLHNKKLTILVMDGGDDYILFQGMIKNKSELVKLMKQIKINE